MLPILVIPGGLYIGVVVVVLLFIYIGKNRNNMLLAYSSFFIWLSLLISYLHLTNKILQYPYLFRTGNITAYLIFPFLFLYTRNSFYSGWLIQRKDWWIFLPALLYIVNLLPFFISSEAHKINILNLYSKDPELLFKMQERYFFPNGFHVIFRYIWGLFFYVLQLCVSL